MRGILLGALIVFVASPSFSAPQWYKGKVTRIWQYNSEGEFIITLEPSLNFCTHKYAYFTESKFGAERLDSALSIALSALHSEAELGVVIDPDERGANGRCYPKSLDVRNGY